MVKIKVFIIVLTWNRKDLVLSCLRSLHKVITKYDLRIVVVDNGSVDNTINTVRKKFPIVKIIENRKNLGWSGGNNVGIKYALRLKAEYVVLLNNDTIITPDCIDFLIDGLRKEKKVGIISPKILKYKSASTISNAGNFLNSHYYGIALGAGEKDKGQYKNIFYTDFVSGVVCARSDVYRKVGLFDESYFLYFEDSDFCLRAKKHGFLCKFVQKAVLYHMESATIGNNSPSHAYYNTRNHLLFVEKYATKDLLMSELFISVRLAVSKIIKKRKNGKYTALGVFDYLLRRFGERTYW